jgi:hypothetical protein
MNKFGWVFSATRLIVEHGENSSKKRYSIFYDTTCSVYTIYRYIIYIYIYIYTYIMINWEKFKTKLTKPTAAGFEPARVNPTA